MPTRSLGSPADPARKMRRDNRVVVLGLLKEGSLSSKDIAEKSGVSYATVLKYKRESELEVLENTDLSQLADLAKSSLGVNLDKPLTQLEVHQKLGDKFAEVADHIVSRIGYLSESAEDAKDISLLASAIASLQTAFFTKPGTNVAILNSGGEPSSTQLKLFEAIKRD